MFLKNKLAKKNIYLTAEDTLEKCPKKKLKRESRG